MGGKYCSEIGAELPTDDCTEGYYCELGMDRAEPTGGNATTDVSGTCVLTGGQTGIGDICPQGHYCPTGTTTPILCAAGSYSNVTGLALCVECPAGYYCLEGITIFVTTNTHTSIYLYVYILKLLLVVCELWKYML